MLINQGATIITPQSENFLTKSKTGNLKKTCIQDQAWKKSIIRKRKRETQTKKLLTNAFEQNHSNQSTTPSLQTSWVSI